MSTKAMRVTILAIGSILLLTSTLISVYQFGIRVAAPTVSLVTPTLQSAETKQHVPEAIATITSLARIKTDTPTPLSVITPASTTHSEKQLGRMLFMTAGNTFGIAHISTLEISHPNFSIRDVSDYTYPKWEVYREQDYTITDFVVSPDFTQLAVLDPQTKKLEVLNLIDGTEVSITLAEITPEWAFNTHPYAIGMSWRVHDNGVSNISFSHWNNDIDRAEGFIVSVENEKSYSVTYGNCLATMFDNLRNVYRRLCATIEDEQTYIQFPFFEKIETITLDKSTKKDLLGSSRISPHGRFTAEVERKGDLIVYRENYVELFRLRNFSAAIHPLSDSNALEWGSSGKIKWIGNEYLLAFGLPQNPDQCPPFEAYHPTDGEVLSTESRPCWMIIDPFKAEILWTEMDMVPAYSLEELRQYIFEDAVVSDDLHYVALAPNVTQRLAAPTIIFSVLTNEFTYISNGNIEYMAFRYLEQ